MKRLFLAVAVVNVVAAVANRLIARPQVPADLVPDSWPLTEDEARVYHAVWSACVQESVAMRQGMHDEDFAAWESEPAVGGEQR